MKLAIFNDFSFLFIEFDALNAFDAMAHVDIEYFNRCLLNTKLFYGDDQKFKPMISQSN